MQNFKILTILILIGILVHYPSFNLSIYGDDWMHIFNYNLPTYNGFFSPLPGVLRYLSPYGFSIMMMGSLYNIFGTHYQFYFLTALAFKIFTAFALYLVLSSLPSTTNHKKSSVLLSLLIAVFSLVTVVGIQNTDWVFFMNIYLATAFFLLGLYFHIKFYQQPKTKLLLWGLLGVFMALIVGTVRLFPLVIIIPLLDIYFFVTSTNKILRLKIGYKIFFFCLVLLALWALGVFGGGFLKIYNFGDWSPTKFIQTVLTYPQVSLTNLLFWFGIVIFPNELVSWSKRLFLLLGITGSILLVYSIIKGIRKTGNHSWLLLFSLSLFIFMVSIWYYLPTTEISSSHRYLYVVFICFCLWLFELLRRFKFASLIVIVLILINSIILHNLYGVWLASGRSSAYIKKIDNQIVKDLSKPIPTHPIIYIEADTVPLGYAVVFGLGYKMLVLTNNFDRDYYPDTYVSKTEMIDGLKDKLLPNGDNEEILSHIYAYKATEDNILNISDSVKQDIKNNLLPKK